jgi:ribosomal protein L22
LEGAKKTLINLPKLQQFETSISDPSLGLSENQKQAARLLGAMSPETGQEYLKATLRESNVKTRQSDISKQNYEQRAALEEKKLKRIEAKIPGNILANAIKNKDVDPTDMQAVVGLLQGAGVSLPKTENEARIFVSRILNSPKIKTLLPPVEQKSFSQSIKDFFTRKKPAEQQPAQTPAPQPQQGFTIKRIK